MNPDKITPATMNRLYIMGLAVTLAGAGGSLAMLMAEAENTPLFLLILFIGWVLSPFAGLVASSLLSKRWPIFPPVTLYFLMLIVAASSLVGYSGALDPPDVRPAFKFLMIPLTWWILFVIVSLIFKKRRQKDKQGKMEA